MRLVAMVYVGAMAMLAVLSFASGQALPAPTDAELMQQQLSSVHNGADALERRYILLLAKAQAEAEAQKATLVDWLAKAQTEAQPK